jgi:methionine-rich copper-binding protein CopC
MRVVGRQLLLWLVASAALLLGTGTAFAHDVLIGSDPADGASLPVGPNQVTLRFDLPVQETFSTITVVGPDGGHFEAGPARVDGSTVTAPVRPLGPAGPYTIGYRIVSDDGHPLSGSIRFTLTQPGPGQGVPAAAAAGAPQQAAPGGEPSNPPSGQNSGGAPVWPWIIGAIVLVVAGVTVALRLGRTRD